MKKRKISITSENGVKMAIESECTSEQAKKINANRLHQVVGFEKDFDVNVFTRDKTVIIEKTLKVATLEAFSAMETIANEFFNMVDSWQLKEPENTEETSPVKHQEHVAFCKAVLCDWDKSPHTQGAAIMAKLDSNSIIIPIGWVAEDLLKELLECYVEHNS